MLARLTLPAFLAASLAAHAGPLTDAFKAGRLSAAEHAGPPQDDADRATLCRLRLFENRLPDAIACLRADLAAKGAQVRLGVALFRSGDFAGAATAFTAAGLAAKAAEAAALAAAPSYVIRATPTPARIAFLRTDPLPVLPVTLPDGHVHHFVLDTGAGETVLAPQLAASLGLAPISAPQTGIFAGGKTAPLSTAILPGLTLGPVHIAHLPVQLLPTAAFASVTGDDAVGGVLGVDVLRHFTAVIDYPGGALILDRPGVALPAAATQLPIWLAGDHLILTEGALNGVPELTLFDTGMAGPVCTAPASTLAAAGVRLDADTVTGQGGGGAVQMHAFRASSLSLGPVTRNNLAGAAGAFPTPLEANTGARIGLLVSHGFLRGYRVWIDLRGMRIALQG